MRFLGHKCIFFFWMINVNASLLLLDGVAADDSGEAFFFGACVLVAIKM